MLQVREERLDVMVLQCHCIDKVSPDLRGFDGISYLKSKRHTACFPEGRFFKRVSLHARRVYGSMTRLAEGVVFLSASPNKTSRLHLELGLSHVTEPRLTHSGGGDETSRLDQPQSSHWQAGQASDDLCTTALLQELTRRLRSFRRAHARSPGVQLTFTC